MTSKYDQQEQLQISQFIKDPSTLKLLILAGTNIKSAQLHTVAKCTNLIKLDLSSNMLSDVPITFSHFTQLKILYLHENNIFSVTIQKSTVEYITLFNNPYKNYRQKLVSNNDKLMAIDFNIVTKKEKLLLIQPLPFTQLKWPIVQTSSNLQSQEDYLNLLKAEIFVITNLCKKANSVETMQGYISSFKTYRDYQKLKSSMSDDMKYKKSNVLQIALHWRRFVKRKQKLKVFLASRNKQHLLYNNLDVIKKNRSPEINQVIQRFIKSIRDRLRARKVLSPYLASYRQFIPAFSQLMSNYILPENYNKCTKLYFLKSELHFLDKIFLYAKRLLFNQKQYDLCDNFEKLVKREKQQYYVFRMKQKDLNQKSFLSDSIRRTISLILAQKGLDRKHLLYNRKGHKYIGLKNREKLKLKHEKRIILQQKIQKTTQTINKTYQKYDNIIFYSIYDDNLFKLLIKIIRFFNAGNSSVILSNQAAYFQTEVMFQNQQQQLQKQKMFIGMQFFMRRLIAVNTIQKFWRRVQSKKKSSIDVIRRIKQNRARGMISYWLRGLAFKQRTQINKILSYRKTIQKSTDMYIQLQIYMKLPSLTNILKLQKYHKFQHDSNQTLYSALHANTYVEIVQLSNRKWIRIIFPSIQKVHQFYKLLLFTTFKFYFNGFYLRLFNYFEAQENQLLVQYQRKVRHLYRIAVTTQNNINAINSQRSSTNVSKKLPIQNMEPYFIWAQIGQKGIQTKFQMEKKSVPISIFIYNKHQKPLKINCDVNWLNPTSIYFNKKQVVRSSSLYASIRSRTPTKKHSVEKSYSIISGDEIHQHYVNKMRSSQKRDRRLSQISPHNTVLLRNHRLKNRGASQHVQVDLLSQTLNIRKK